MNRVVQSANGKGVCLARNRSSLPFYLFLFALAVTLLFGSRLSYAQEDVALLHPFSPLSNGTNGDGASPAGDILVASNGLLYGVAPNGGTNGTGVVFATSLSGAFITLYNFSPLDANGHNTDGANPKATLVQDNYGNLYGTTTSGGANGTGTVFQLTLSGHITTLHSFGALNNGTNSDGAEPNGLLLATDGDLYGTAPLGGQNGNGTIFQLKPNAQHLFVNNGSFVGSFNTLYSFSAMNSGVNSDGAEPLAPLMQAKDGYFYGTAYLGGTNGTGTVYQMQLDNMSNFKQLIVLHAFTSVSNTGTNIDGANPAAPLVQVCDGDLYGTTVNGGNGSGVIFRIQPGSGGQFVSGNTFIGIFSVIYSFSTLNNGINNDGAHPNAGLVQGPNCGDLYGSAPYGGPNGTGILFRLPLSGPPLVILHNFSPLSNNGTNPDGANPNSVHIGPGGSNLIASTSHGGPNGNGTVDGWGLWLQPPPPPSFPAQPPQTVPPLHFHVPPGWPVPPANDLQAKWQRGPNVFPVQVQVQGNDLIVPVPDGIFNGAPGCVNCQINNILLNGGPNFNFNIGFPNLVGQPEARGVASCVVNNPRLLVDFQIANIGTSQANTVNITSITLLDATGRPVSNTNRPPGGALVGNIGAGATVTTLGGVGPFALTLPGGRAWRGNLCALPRGSFFLRVTGTFTNPLLPGQTLPFTLLIPYP